jgi:hypothetical protein
MFNRERSVVDRHFSVVLAGNGVARSVGTFFKHASTLDKVFRVGHRTSLSETISACNVRDAAPHVGAQTFDKATGTALPREVHDAVQKCAACMLSTAAW